ncbi:MAG TPA: NHL repeat-containing protein [Methylomirabilota bacterium]|nr:NHL repeat-containing protein [Methylomirabilota bacterium]
MTSIRISSAAALLSVLLSVPLSAVAQDKPTAPHGTISGAAGEARAPETTAQATSTSVSPSPLAVSTGGDVYFGSEGSGYLLKLDPQKGLLTRVGGSNLHGYWLGIAVDGNGAIFVAERDSNSVLKVAPDGTVSTVAGNGTAGYSGDGGPATRAQLKFPQGLALDSAGNLYIADSSNHRVRRVALDGTISTVAGNGTPGYSGDGGPATDAQLNAPIGIAVDAANNLYIADYGNERVRKVGSDGIISTVAGKGLGDGHCQTPPADGGPATSGQLCGLGTVAVDMKGNVYISDSGNQRVRKVSHGVISTVAGNGTAGYSGDGGPAVRAQLNFPDGIAVDSLGNLYIADSANMRIRKVAPDGIISTVAGNGVGGFTIVGNSWVSLDTKWPDQ